MYQSKIYDRYGRLLSVSLDTPHTLNPQSFAEFRIKHTIPVIEIRVTSARDYRAGRPTHDVLSEAGDAGVLSISRILSSAEGLTIFPFHIHARGRYGVAGRLSSSAFQDDELLANRWCRWPRSRSSVGFLCASRDSTTLIVCRRVRIILR